VIELGEARVRVLVAARTLEPERIELSDALGRVAADDLRSPVDLPPFDRSAMDGYAVRSEDVAAGVALTVVGDIPAGSTAPNAGAGAGGATALGAGPGALLGAGEAVGISTGSAIPPGADAVLQSEHAQLAGSTLTAIEGVESGRHIRRRGEDIREGEVLVTAGSVLTVQRISALASVGIGALRVARRARLALLVTGSELLPLGAPPEPGRIHESNGLTLRLLAERAGAEVIDLGVVGDDAAETQERLAAGLEDADVLVVTGGVSVGEHDHVRPALDALGVEESFWRVRMRPGKPIYFGTRDNTLVFGLPGNPLSAVVGFLNFVEPAIRALHGEPDPSLRTFRVTLAADAAPSGGRTTFLTATFSPDGTATPTDRQGSHMTGALGASDGFVILDRRCRAGDVVDAVRL
jgi:molybdopterin molybdotransferase